MFEAYLASFIDYPDYRKPRLFSRAREDHPLMHDEKNG